MCRVSGVGLSSFQRLHNSRTHSGRDLAASFSQLPTESLTYFASSDRNGSSSGRASSGLD
jgi:hypothetical protein